MRGVIVDANELNFEKYDLDMDNALSWSPDNRKIERAIMDQGYDKNTTMNIHYIKEQYSELDFTSMGIIEIDKDMLTFPNLKILELSQNNIHTLTNLPMNLEECIITNNGLSRLDNRLLIPSLQYLNVSGNLLSEAHLSKIMFDYRPSSIYVSQSLKS